MLCSIWSRTIVPGGLTLPRFVDRRYNRAVMTGLGLRARSSCFPRKGSAMCLRISRSIAATIVASAMLWSCGGGNKSIVSGTPNQVTSSSQGRLILSGTLNGSGPRLLANVRRAPSGGSRLHPLAFTFSHILVQGTFYPGDAGNNPVTNSITIPVPPSGVYTASVPFSNVPVHNNEWGLLQFIGVAADNSQIAIGELAGIVNVTSSSTNSATLTDTTTRTFQIFSDLLQDGFLSTFDLDGSATLASTLTTKIGAAPFDPTTHLFTASEQSTLINSIAPSFERNVTITASPATNGSYIILRDYTNANELELASNTASFFSTFPMLAQPAPVGNVIGAGESGGFFILPAQHIPPTNPLPVPFQVSAAVVGGLGATTVRNVYGGHLLIGATSNAYVLAAPSLPPFTGGFTTSAGHAPGAFSVTVPTASTQLSIAVTDLAGFAFGAPFFATQPPFLGTFFLQINFGNAPLSATSFVAPTVVFPLRVIVPTPYNASSNKIAVDTFNPWDIASTNEQLCGGINCYVFTAPQPLAIARPFADAGNKLSFFNWKASGTATAISQNPSGGYNVSISGPGTATLTSTTASHLTARQHVFISSNLLTPSTWTLTAKDALSNVYSNSAVGSFGTVTIEMVSVGNLVATTQIVITFTTLAPSTVTIRQISD